MLRVFARGIRRIAMSESHSPDPFLVRKRGCVPCKKDVKRLTFGSVEPAHGEGYRIERGGEPSTSPVRDPVASKPNPLKMCF